MSKAKNVPKKDYKTRHIHVRPETYRKLMYLVYHEDRNLIEITEEVIQIGLKSARFRHDTAATPSA